ncbi:MAG: four helix bundle protein [Bacteroidales bacterium]|nr:four helix bundle protein [Bacteroidales bacterium]
MNENENNNLLTKTYDFALRIVEQYKYLSEVKREYILSKQLLRSGTSIGANSEEAFGSISKKEFRAKLFISYKEARETKYWIRLMKDSDYLENKISDSLLDDLNQILKILGAILKKISPVNVNRT